MYCQSRIVLLELMNIIALFSGEELGSQDLGHLQSNASRLPLRLHPRFPYNATPNLLVLATKPLTQVVLQQFSLGFQTIAEAEDRIASEAALSSTEWVFHR